jgi:hypothetical protein
MHHLLLTLKWWNYTWVRWEMEWILVSGRSQRPLLLSRMCCCRLPSIYPCWG